MNKNKVSEFFTNFFKTRNVAFYVAFGFAVLAFVGGITATAGASAADCGPLPLVFTLLGLIAFVGLSLVKHEWAGAGAVAVASFMSIVAAICGVYPYYLAEIQDLAMTGITVGKILALPGLSALIGAIVLFVICAIAANVLAWLRLRKPTDEEIAIRNAKRAAKMKKKLSLDEPTTVCSNCGCPMNIGDKFCGVCGRSADFGASVETEEVENTEGK